MKTSPEICELWEEFQEKYSEYFISNEEKYLTVQVYHDGKCGRCGKTLTTPKSLKSGS